MGKSYGRKEGEDGGYEPLSERVKGVAFFWTALSMVGLTAALVRRTSSRRRIAARRVHEPARVGVVTHGMIAKASEAAMLKVS
jgi:hypothetical protein